MALHFSLFWAALLDDADEKHVVLVVFGISLSEFLFASGASGRQVAPQASPAKRVTATHCHRFAHEEQANGTFHQVHFELYSSAKRPSTS